MKILRRGGFRKVYYLTCPCCKSELEAEEHEVQSVSTAISAFFCPVCRDYYLLEDHKIMVKFKLEK